VDGALADLARVRQRLDAVIDHYQLDREHVVDEQALSYATGIAVGEVRVLLDGGVLPPQEVAARIRARIRFLYDTRPGGGRHHDQRDIARAMGVSPEWVRLLINGKKAPNLEHTHKLTGFFGVPGDFLTVAPEEALARKLQRTLDDLERAVADPMAQLSRRYGPVAVSLRGRVPRERLHELIDLIGDVLERQEGTR
jgi:transcriptional regulator with XRE-family HTH domain